MKFWEPNQFLQLAANEYFCLNVARKCGLDVPPYRLAEDARDRLMARAGIVNPGEWLPEVYSNK